MPSRKPPTARATLKVVAEKTVLPAHGEDLLRAARAVRSRAHAPYSRFRVGAAVLDERGRIHVGCNVENASYGLTVCAERNALAAAVAAGARRLQAVCVVTSAVPAASPCGACRQVLAELAPDEATVILAGPRGRTATVIDLGSLLPRAFRFERSARRRG